MTDSTAVRKFKDAVRAALKGLLLPPLQEIVCEYVQLTTLSGTDAMDWRTNHLCVAFEIKPDISSSSQSGFHVWRPDDLPQFVWGQWNGPKIKAVFNAREVDKRAREIWYSDPVVFTFSDENNWCLDPDPQFTSLLGKYNPLNGRTKIQTAD